MKKIIYIIILGLFFFINACTGYVPIYSSSNLNFKIENHSIEGEERLGNLIYRKLYNATLSAKDNPSSQSITLNIETIKEKRSTVKNSVGKILEYEIDLKTHTIINDYLTDKIILDRNFDYSISYKVQDVHSETIKLENKNIENLLDKTFQDVMIRISEIAKTQ